ncbi:DNA alkylation repair protein [Candidatus Saccharibacteria bacterium]|nr:DNA alkylation repair protein [Candidatus Saccharibacteria bacterium]
MKHVGGGEITSYGELRERLAFYADDDYLVFAKKGIPSERPFVGVKIPTVRSVVNLIPSKYYDVFLNTPPVAFEEVLARGMIICKLPYDEMLKWFDSQIDYIDDWANCDVFCSGVRRVIQKHLDEFLDLKVEGLLWAREEYTVRVGLVMLKCAYVKPDYLALIFDRVENLGECEEYYVRMAIAWLLSECFIKYPDETLGYLRASRLPVWTFNKTISKICDSYRVEAGVKDILRKMRK